MWERIRRFFADPFGYGELLDQYTELYGELLVRQAKQRRAEGHIRDLKIALKEAEARNEAAEVRSKELNELLLGSQRLNAAIAKEKQELEKHIASTAGARGEWNMQALIALAENKARHEEAQRWAAIMKGASNGAT